MTAIRRTAPIASRNTGPKQETIKGKVSLKLVNKGSKSESRSLVMTVKGKSVRLQRLGGNPFEIDAKEKALVGKSVELKGYFISDSLFRFTSATTAKQ
jgi:hypothetical protein